MIGEALAGCRQCGRHRLPRALPPVEVLRQAVIAVLERTAALPQGQRLWLRPRQLIAAAELSVREAQDCMRSAPGALFSCHGVCVAASAPFQLPAARTFRCACCSNEFTQHSHGAAASPKPCCTEAALLEVEQARVMVQVGVRRWMGTLCGCWQGPQCQAILALQPLQHPLAPLTHA